MPAQARAQPRSPRSLDDAIRAIPAAWFHAEPVIYWTDLTVSAGLGWTSFVLAGRAWGWRRVALLTLAIIALYRAVLFIHEITHRAKRDVPAFAWVWNAAVGLPLLLPSFLYEGVHTDHHRQRSYGTEADPEYVPYGRRSPALIATSLIASLFVPLAFVVRFGILAPLSWIVPAWRRLVEAHASALVINHRYVRRIPISAAGRIEEAGATAVVYGTLALWWTGRLGTIDLEDWLLVGAVISIINAVRTLAAHRYDAGAGELSMTEQLLDSWTIAPVSGIGGRALAMAGSAVHAILAPVGLRYHALHHWIPSLPYHNLGRAHRQLVGSLSGDAPYRTTEAPHMLAAIGDLVQRARTRGTRAP